MLRSTTATLALTIFISAITASLAMAATGTIISPDQYSWSDNGGYINWNATGGNVTVSDTALTGYIWSAGFGWINLAPTQGGVTNSNGVLGGWAWGENTGWINFTGVTIDSNGVFHGHTVAQSTFGTMTFDCTYCNVTTSWRPSTAPSSPASTGNGPPVSTPPSPQTTSATTNNRTAASATIPPSLIPTSAPPSIQPRSAPKATHAQNGALPSKTRTATPLSSATSSSIVPTSSTTVYNHTPSATAAPLVQPCSLLTCWLRDLWQFVIARL